MNRHNKYRKTRSDLKKTFFAGAGKADKSMGPEVNKFNENSAKNEVDESFSDSSGGAFAATEEVKE